MVRVLLIGQEPPPYHGQAVMISTFVHAEHEGVEVDFLPMEYSATVAEVGRIRLRKVWQLVRLVSEAVRRSLRRRIDVVYYPPAGAGRVPVIRDILTLLIIRRLGRPIVYHFHALGLQGTYRSLGRVSRALFRAAYFEPDLCICPAAANLAEIRFLNPAATAVVPYGVPDTEDPDRVVAARRRSATGGESEVGLQAPARDGTDLVTVLFVGNLIESKGVWRLLRLAERLEANNMNARVILVGSPPNETLMELYAQHAATRAGSAVFTGPLFGEDKLALLRRAEVFCFPSTYESENFPVVLIEAMRAGLPVVSSTWRGIPEIIEDGVCGFLVDADDDVALFDRVRVLLEDRTLRQTMGEAGRARYEARFTERQYVAEMDRVLRDVARGMRTRKSARHFSPRR